MTNYFTIEQKKLYNTETSTTVGAKIYWRYQDRNSQAYGLYTTIHEMGHVISNHDKKKMDYFMSELETHCSNQWWFQKSAYCNTRQQSGVKYDAGPFAVGSTSQTQYMPSLYALVGSYEDFAETWREVVVKAYIDSGDTAYITEANLVYAYDINSHDIGQRRIVMTSIIDGSWK